MCVGLDNRHMRASAVHEPTSAPRVFAEHLNGIAHCLIDRDGRVIGCNLPIGNGPLLEQAPAMAQILRELVAGVPAEQLRARASQVLERIDAELAREPRRGSGDRPVLDFLTTFGHHLPGFPLVSAP
jgi:hypothetical protein